ncbi:MAG: hypothetical protein ACI9SJ_000502 [Flavobacteriaceae bacterium]|jgi:hypothetical protein|uniref:hypothetical protein n=1 Tax=Candidatus Marifrigoribacter sp. Uisw_064 TaxID=3230970 RepID=UPI003ADEC19E
MTRTTKILAGISVLIFLLSFFLPSRLTNYDFATIISYAKNNQIGYSIYGLLFFPIVLLLILFKKYFIGICLSTFIILTQIDSFDRFLDFLTADNKSTIGIEDTYPFLLVTSLVIYLVYKSVKSKKWNWYISFISLVILSYLIFNDRNCTIEFVEDMGFKKYDIGVWFSNCGTYYAWWTSAILINIGLFNEIKREKTVVNNVKPKSLLELI